MDDLISYEDYNLGLPSFGRFIIGSMSNHSIRVYQAYNHKIANYAIENQKFGGPHYSFNRMTWIKPNFLWMMYRSGWASKVNQERVLSIEIPTSYFISLVEVGVISSFNQSSYNNQEDWKTAISNSDVRLQWDPDHDYLGNKLKRKAIQIGIRGEELHSFNDNIISIDDVTEFVFEQRNRIENKKDFLVPSESVLIDSYPNRVDLIVEKCVYSIGGLREVGFKKGSDIIMVLSSQGRGIFDCLECEKIERDPYDYYTHDWDSYTGLVKGIGKYQNENFICGGFEYPDPISKRSKDWIVLKVRTTLYSDYFKKYINSELICIESSKRQLSNIINNYSFYPTDRGFGFSDTGKTFVHCTSSDIHIFKTNLE